ncbi:MAG: NAD-dependent epimerase/dehydratase family protein [Planctomycetota bacterium]|nr:NAD-dependent epimerase/dehydratase family protein [Planctomycetota bacterium]
MTHPTRRAVLAAGLSMPLAAQATSGSRNRPAGKLLVLGGTRFLGPPIVQAAQAAGWEVTLCNRGRSNPGMFADLERIVMDRNDCDATPLRGRKFDAVVDTSGYAPLHVQLACEALADSVDHYVFVSTVSVYPDQSAAVVDEDTETGSVDAASIAEARTIRQATRRYGAMKAECERAAEKAMPGRVTNVRPGLIVGPRDTSRRFSYWPARVARGGEILAPANPDAETQVIDVRDLGNWCFELADNKTSGAFNAVGFKGRVSLAEVLHACKLTLNTECEFTWVDEDFLLANKARPYTELPLWLPKGQRGHFANDRAVAAGLSFRPLVVTIADCQEWRLSLPPEQREKFRLTPEREAEWLKAFKAR